MAKSSDEIIQGLEQVITQNQPSADTSAGSVLRDVALEPFAEEISSVYTSVDGVKLVQSLSNAASISTNDMDSQAANFGLTRNPATAATGQVTFGTATKPTTTIQIGSGGGSGGIGISTIRGQSGKQASFVTTATVYLTTSTVLNPISGLYEVTAPIQAITPGTASNVGANTLTVVSGSIPPGITCTNKIAVTNGVDIESNTTLAGRIQQKIKGNVLGNKDGYASAALSVSGVEQVLVISPSDPQAMRGVGGIDVFLLGSAPSSTSQTQNYASEAQLALTSPPVLSITSVVGLVSSISHVFIQDVDYMFQQDTTSVYARSLKAQDKLVWLVAGTKPDIGTAYTITYQMENLVSLVDAVYQDADNHIITNDVLVKHSSEVLVDVAISVSLLSGFDRTITRNAIITELTTFIDALQLGQSLNQSDIVLDLRTKVSGINNIIIPFTTLARRGNSGSQDLTAAPYEHFTVDSNSFAITIL